MALGGGGGGGKGETAERLRHLGLDKRPRDVSARFRTRKTEGVGIRLLASRGGNNDIVVQLLFTAY
jgi:hypothetical protein